jgi:hypothetical protein
LHKPRIYARRNNALDPNWYMRNIAHMSRSIAAIKDAEQKAAARGVKPAELHAAAGVHRATWNRWRQGIGGPNLDQLAAIDELLNRRSAPSEAA